MTSKYHQKTTKDSEEYQNISEKEKKQKAKKGPRKISKFC